MTNSHIIDGLIRQWRSRDPDADRNSPRHRCGEITAKLLTRFIRMMYHDGDLDRPNCFEHYNPHTGRACTYRGIDDYQHSYVLDLIVRGVAGLHPPLRLGRPIVIDPLPMPLDHVQLTGARIRGKTHDIERRGEEITVTVDGRFHEAKLGQPLVL